MGLFILRFWPILLPLLVYIIWINNKKHKARKAGEKEPGFRDGPWFWVVVASLLIGVVMLLMVGINQEQQDDDYIPPRLQGENESP